MLRWGLLVKEEMGEGVLHINEEMEAPCQRCDEGLLVKDEMVGGGLLVK